MDMEVPGFEALEHRVSIYAPAGLRLRMRRLPGWALAIGMGGFLVVLGIPYVVSDSSLDIWLLGALGVQVVSLVVFVFTALGTKIAQLKNPARTFAGELDADYNKYSDLLAWLRRFPPEDLHRRLRYVRGRRDWMSVRFGLLAGGMDRLGVLPVAVALYIQFKDGIGPISFSQGLLAGILFLLYALSWFVAGLKLRLDLYVRLMEDALPLPSLPSKEP
ncbi:MAG: hypothetical protein H0W24_00180 [Lysobacter sp.]|nr:hypothetical protein [Lysobacter sp.]MDQ3269773.1 hypothetical protein [Pseudomonadota bacterium]